MFTYYKFLEKKQVKIRRKYFAVKFLIHCFLDGLRLYVIDRSMEWRRQSRLFAIPHGTTKLRNQATPTWALNLLADIADRINLFARGVSELQRVTLFSLYHVYFMEYLCSTVDVFRLIWCWFLIRLINQYNVLLRDLRCRDKNAHTKGRVQYESCTKRHGAAMLGIELINRVQNSEIRSRTKIQDIGNWITKLKWN